MLDLLTELRGSQLVPERELERTERYLQFQVEDLSLLMPLQQLREVLPVSPERILPVPDMSPLLLGLISWRSEAIWLLDLPLLLGGSPFRRNEQGRASVLLAEGQDVAVSAPSSKQSLIFGLLVDSVQTLFAFPPERILPLSLEVVKPAQKHLFQGYYLSEAGQPLLILDAQAIAQTLLA
ncbi:chemotaxis protein CheW [Synechococcus sp. Nb3U1]|uniref:chemotaxis protein CheW n=1 Tax=Synechococcus sp. Nb3U1 TaxID=1914529 RepID=UPI001F2B3AC5|nr:chemotaxis protein CheW [Synechococcus sp. Nb3U1]MCF2970493.1 chemotaxis protein CheW [Synechococcus sp. Nb3U1]